jgi:hypothetical protein
MIDAQVGGNDAILVDNWNDFPLLLCDANVLREQGEEVVALAAEEVG